jgi:hypothetical protein
MNTNRAMTLSSSGYTRMGELLVLVLLAAVLIGQIFFTQGDATWLETELVLLGGIIGIMVSCAKTPLHNWFMRRSRANAEWQWFREDVLATAESRSPESRDSQPQDRKPADITRHAA